jgi:predicted negative regulator of RcsB-dependent stress response
VYASDDEQFEIIKRWWRENGRSVIAGVIIAVIAVVGWQQWTAYRQRAAEAASMEYVAFLEELRKKDAGQGALERGAAIMEEYPSTSYAMLTAFWLAQYHVEHNQLPEAAERLHWALENADSEAMKHVARTRLARILLAQGQYQEALGMVSVKASSVFDYQYDELRGDVYSAQGINEEAIKAYQKVSSDQRLAPQHREVVKLKLNDLGAAAEPLS